jgi:hypothetical protein
MKFRVPKVEIITGFTVGYSVTRERVFNVKKASGNAGT